MRRKSIRFALALAALLAVAAQSFAATKTWQPKAADIPEIKTITISGTWATNDTGTLTINGNNVTVTVLGATPTTADVATSIKDAVNATGRLDGTGTPSATSNVGGQQVAEFAEVTASVSGSVVTLVCKTAGKPFTVSVSDTSASGTVGSPSTTQAATGKNFWNNTANWDTGTVPANGDTCVFRDGAAGSGPKYGLPNGSLEVAIVTYGSFQGQIGLPTINSDGVLPYPEYRQTDVVLDDSGAASRITHTFGLGGGSGASLVNLRHATLPIDVVIYAGTINVCGGGTASTLQVSGGTVDASDRLATSARWSDVKVTGDNAYCIVAAALNAAVAFTQTNGTLILRGSQTGNVTISVTGGSCTVDDFATSGTITVYAGAGNGQKGAVYWNSTDTITAGKVYKDGTFDASRAQGAFTVTNCELYAGASFLDPAKRITYTNPIQLQCRVSELTKFDIGLGRTIQPAG